MLRSTRLLKEGLLTEGPCFVAWVSRGLSPLEFTLWPVAGSFCATVVGIPLLPQSVQKGVVIILPHGPQKEVFGTDVSTF